MATRLFERSAVTTDGSRRFGATVWCVERDIEGRPGTVQFIRCTTREQAETELGDETPENAPWHIRSAKKRRGWKL
jgi:hypothetical protein